MQTHLRLVWYFCIAISSLFHFLLVYVKVNFSLDAKRFQIGIITGSRQEYVSKILIFSTLHFAPKKRGGKWQFGVAFQKIPPKGTIAFCLSANAFTTSPKTSFLEE
jgi:hypothetical protein